MTISWKEGEADSIFFACKCYVSLMRPTIFRQWDACSATHWIYPFHTVGLQQWRSMMAKANNGGKDSSMSEATGRQMQQEKVGTLDLTAAAAAFDAFVFLF